VIAVDSSTGAQRLVASGGYIAGPFAIQYMKSHIFLADSGTIRGTTPNIIEITPRTGKQTLITPLARLTFESGSRSLVSATRCERQAQCKSHCIPNQRQRGR
jgi:hypothetical protein